MVQVNVCCSWLVAGRDLADLVEFHRTTLDTQPLEEGPSSGLRRSFADTTPAGEAWPRSATDRPRLVIRPRPPSSSSSVSDRPPETRRPPRSRSHRSQSDGKGPWSWCCGEEEGQGSGWGMIAEASLERREEVVVAPSFARVTAIVDSADVATPPPSLRVHHVDGSMPAFLVHPITHHGQFLSPPLSQDLDNPDTSSSSSSHPTVSRRRGDGPRGARPRAGLGGRRLVVHLPRTRSSLPVPRSTTDRPPFPFPSSKNGKRRRGGRRGARERRRRRRRLEERGKGGQRFEEDRLDSGAVGDASSGRERR